MNRSPGLGLDFVSKLLIPPLIVYCRKHVGRMQSSIFVRPQYKLLRVQLT